jgi:hypothetical protein
VQIASSHQRHQRFNRAWIANFAQCFGGFGAHLIIFAAVHQHRDQRLYSLLRAAFAQRDYRVPPHSGIAIFKGVEEIPGRSSH